MGYFECVIFSSFILANSCFGSESCH